MISSRDTIVQSILAGLRKIRQTVSTQIQIVPLTASSGHMVRHFLVPLIKDLRDRGIVLQPSIRDALADSGDETAILFVDDNLNSGGQAEKQLRAYFGKLGEDEFDENIFRSALSTDEQRKLQKCRIGFIFDVAAESGITTLSEAATSLTLRLDREWVLFGTAFNAISGKGTISEELRQFLHKVGTGCLYRRRQLEKPGAEQQQLQQWAVTHALGYGGSEGLMVTPFNVPTSTYTALWCPGLYNPDGNRQFELDGDEIPWVPLFLRAGMFRYLVLAC